MTRKVTAISLFFFLLCLIPTKKSDAAGSNWQEKQDALFKQTGLKEGEIINKSNWRKVENLVPFNMLEWLKKGKMEITTGAFKYDASHDDKWVKAGLKNAGKYKLDKNVLVKTKTGKPPGNIYGIPFPGLDIKNDPEGAAKLIYNRQLNVQRHGSVRSQLIFRWVGKNGFERELESDWIVFAHWARPKPFPNPFKYKWLDIANVKKPYDLAGITQLTLRNIDGKGDEVYAYIPAIRRVKRMSGANRSDAYMGSDVTLDDGWGFSGLTASMKWRFIEEKIGLLLITDWAAEHTKKMTLLPNGTYKSPADEVAVKMAYEVEGWSRKSSAIDPWLPVNSVFIPRKFYIVEAIPLDPFYSAGKMVFWIDKETLFINYRLSWDKAGVYWRIGLYPPVCTEWGENKGVISCNLHQQIDEKTQHSTSTINGGEFHGKRVFMTYHEPKIQPKMFTVGKIRMWSK